MFSRRTAWNLETTQLSDALARHRKTGKRLLDLTASNPTTCGFHFENELILQSLGNPAALVYQPAAQGLAVAREAVAKYYLDRGASVSAENIFLTASTSEAYSFIFRTLCDSGDEVLVPAPGYPLFDFLADILDVKIVRYPLVYDYGWQMDFHALESAISTRTRAVVVVHPNNPTGHFCKNAEMKKLTELCTQRGLAIVADEVFLDFTLEGKRPESFVTHDTGLTFTLSGISKIAGLPQMKIAWLVVGGEEKLVHEAKARLEVIADTYLSVSAPPQLAIPVFLQQRQGFHEQWKVRALENLITLDTMLAQQKLCTRLKVEGGWYAVLKIPATRGDDEFALELLEKRGVYVHPGHFYSFSGSEYLVLSLITPAEEFAEGIEALLQML